MSTTATFAAISVANSAQAAAANAAAQEAARRACEVFVTGYTHEGATVDRMRGYADCIARLYPEPMTTDELGAAKVIVAVLFAAVIGGAVWGWRNRSLSDGPFGAVVIGSLIGLLCGGFGLFAAAGAWFGVRLLLA